MKLGLWLLIFSFVAIAYAEDPIQVTPCDLMSDPPQYDKRLVTLRAPIKIEFEGSAFDVKCNNTDLQPIWVTFAGDVEVPVVYCCGNHDRKKGTTVEVEGLKLSLQKDVEFEKYWNLLTAERETAPSGVPCIWECYQYHVTATLTGHFFSGEEWKRDDGKIFYMGYGHLGCCSLFVIEKVAEVQTEPTGIPTGDNWDCSHQIQKLPFDRQGILALQKAVESHALQEPDLKTLGEKIVEERMKESGEDFESGDASDTYEGEFGAPTNQDEFEAATKAIYFWLSKDKLRSYSVTFERFEWLSPQTKKISDRVWTAVSFEHSVCKRKD